MPKCLEAHRTGPVLELVLDRPEVLNALDPVLLLELSRQLERFRDDPELRVLILRGNGRAFSAGADVRAMASMDASAFREQTRLYQTLARGLRHAGKPSLAALHGHIIGGGLELALMADLRVAGTSARFALPDATLGFSPTGGLTYLLPRIVGHGRAAWMALRGEPIDANRALNWGLVSEVFPDEMLVEEAQTIARSLAAHLPEGAYRTRHALIASWHETFDETLQREQEDDERCFACPTTREALDGFLASRGTSPRG